MIEVKCDRCKHNCGSVARVISVDVLHNPSCMSPRDTGDLKLTNDPAHIRFVLCQKCYRQLHLPNVYKVLRNGKIVWDVDEEDKKE